MATSDKEPQSWKHLGDTIRRRREALGLVQEELAEQARISTSSVRQAERGRVPQGYRWPQSLTAIEGALGWTRGSMRAVLAGGEPTVGQEPSDALQETLPEAAPQSPAPTFRTMGWLEANREKVLDEQLPAAEKFGHLCGLLGAPTALVDAYNEALAAMIDSIRAE